MPTTPIMQWGGTQVVWPLLNADDAMGSIKNVNLSDGTYAAGTILGELRGNNEVQHIAVDATSGTFTITYGAQTTGPIAYNATTAVVQAALEALSSVGQGGILVGGSASAYDLTFQGQLGYRNVAQVTTDSTLLVGNTHTATPTTTTAGAAGTPGTFAPYKHGNTDGSQNPSLILQYACVVASGVVTIGGTGAVGGEWGQTQKYASAYRQGLFSGADLVGLDQNALASDAFRLVSGTIDNGEVMLLGA
jgi:hypothetical protein